MQSDVKGNDNNIFDDDVLARLNDICCTQTHSDIRCVSIGRIRVAEKGKAAYAIMEHRSVARYDLRTTSVRPGTHVHRSE